MLYSFLYVIISSFGTVFIEKLYTSIPPFFSLFIIASIATLFFNAVNVGKLKATYKACWQEKKLCFLIMITILVMWVCSIISPGLIGASLFLFIYFSWLGMLGFLSLSIGNWKKDKNKIYFFIALLILLSFTIWDFINNSFSLMNVIGLLLALLGGSSAFIYFKQSQALIKRIQMSATQILAIRFYLTILIMFIIIPKDNFLLNFTINNFISLMLLSFASMIAPLYCQQKALEKITAENNAIIMSLTPAMTGVIQFIVLNNINYKFMLIYFLYSIIIATSYLIKKTQNYRR